MHDLFLESLDTKFYAVRCGSLYEIESRDCKSDNNIRYMGGDYPKSVLKPYGVYYLETVGQPPYLKIDQFIFRNIKVTYADCFSKNT